MQPAMAEKGDCSNDDSRGHKSYNRILEGVFH